MQSKSLWSETNPRRSQALSSGIGTHARKLDLKTRPRQEKNYLYHLLWQYDTYTLQTAFICLSTIGGEWTRVTYTMFLECGDGPATHRWLGFCSLCEFLAAVPIVTLQSFYEGDVCKYRKYRTCRGWRCLEAFWRANQCIKVTSELQKLKGSRARSCNLTFDPLNIKRSRGNDQVIKHTICRSNTLIMVANVSIGNI